MKYKITVEAIDSHIIEVKKWVEVDPFKDPETKEEKKYDYRLVQEEEQTHEQVYSQIVDDNINLAEIIKAVNGGK
ncbi:MAG: hypothetical protein WA019_03530 [Candidatus Moraniibacteriota bacterium]